MAKPNVLTRALHVAEAIVLIVLALPFVVLAFFARWKWDAYSSIWAAPHDYQNALLGIAGVAGVLWSGAVIAFSIHRDYPPELRTGVHLIHFAILAPLIGLVAQGAALRTAFFIVAYFYFGYGLFSVVDLEILKIWKKIPVPAPREGETPEQARQRVALQTTLSESSIWLVRIGHGARYFMFTAILCLATVIWARQDVLAWSCIVIIVLSLLFIVPTIFKMGDAEKSA